MSDSTSKHPVLLNLNIPFCYNQCSFCFRTVVPGYDSQRLSAYVEALRTEILANADEFADCEIQAIHLGGGTASMVQGADLIQLFRVLRENYSFAEDVPVTMLSSMAEINGGQLPFFRRVGITRYDIELMSLDKRDFAVLDFPNHSDWIYTASSSFLHAEQQKNMGFVLLYGKRAIDAARFRHSLVLATRTHCAHIILQKCSDDDLADEDHIARQMAEARDVLPAAGFHEYLPGRWAKEGCEDRYAQLKAQNTDEVSFGMGAETRIDGAFSRNTMNLQTYLNHSADFQAITEGVARG